MPSISTRMAPRGTDGGGELELAGMERQAFGGEARADLEDQWVLDHAGIGQHLGDAVGAGAFRDDDDLLVTQRPGRVERVPEPRGNAAGEEGKNDDDERDAFDQLEQAAVGPLGI